MAIPNLSGYGAADRAYLTQYYERLEQKRLRREAIAEERRRAAQQQQYTLAQIRAQKQVTPSTTTSSTSAVMPSWEPPSTYDIPEYQPYIPGAAPTYAAPEWDEGAISSLTQKRAAPGLRSLRQQVQRVTGRKYDSPQVARMTLREALQGYGSGIGLVLGGAGSAALGEYGQKYGAETEEARTNYGGQMAQWQGETAARSQGAMTNYQAELEKRRTGYQSSWDKWKASVGTTTTSTTR